MARKKKVVAEAPIDPKTKPPMRVIRPQRAAELVAADIRARILRGELDDGLPTEMVLLQEFSVSRPTLREALRILEAEGLLRTRRGKHGGAIVSRPTVDTAAYHLSLVLHSVSVDLGDIAEARHLLEPLCVSLAAKRPDCKEVAAGLELLSDKSEKLIDEAAPFTASLLDFHKGLIEASSNKTLQILVGTVGHVWDSHERAWVEEATESGDYPDRAGRLLALESHRRIARRIAKGDAAGASRAARDHLAATMSYICGGTVGDENEPAEFGRMVDSELLRA